MQWEYERRTELYILQTFWKQSHCTRSSVCTDNNVGLLHIAFNVPNIVRTNLNCPSSETNAKSRTKQNRPCPKMSTLQMCCCKNWHFPREAPATLRRSLPTCKQCGWFSEDYVPPTNNVGCIGGTRHAIYLQSLEHKQLLCNIDFIGVFTNPGTSLRSTLSTLTISLYMKNTAICQKRGLLESPSNPPCVSVPPHTETSHLQTKHFFVRGVETCTSCKRHCHTQPQPDPPT